MNDTNDSNDSNDSSWFKPIGTDDPLPTKASRSKSSYKKMTSRYHLDAYGNATMNRAPKKKRNLPEVKIPKNGWKV